MGNNIRTEKIINEKLQDLYVPLKTVKVIKSRRMRRNRCETRMGERRNADIIMVGNHQGKRPLR
jgi:hypothetical protein